MGKHSASQVRVPPRAEELLHEERPRRQEPLREEQPSLEALREVGELKTLHGKAEVKRKAPKKNKKDAKLEERKRNDEELLATIGQLMEAYTERSVDPAELLSAFEEL